VTTNSLGDASPRGVVAVALLAVGISAITATLRLAAYGVVDLVRSDA
jgi:hypothetical protein